MVGAEDGRLFIDLRLLDILADVDGEHDRSEADPEHGAPGHVRREYSEEECVEERGDSPADGPTALHRADGATAILSSNGFADKDRADGPLPTKAEALQTANNEELIKAVSETTEKSEECEP